MFPGILASFLISLAVVANKKGLSINARKLSNMGYELLGELLLISGLIVLLFASPHIPFLSFESKSFTLTIILTIVALKFFQLLSVYMFYEVFQKEKISTILPLNNFDKVFTILFGFLFFGDTSFTTVVFALIAVVFITLSQIDFSQHTRPKYLIRFISIGACKSTAQLLTGFLLAYLTSFELFLGATLVAIMIMSSFVGYKGELKYIKNRTQKPVVVCRSFDKVMVIIVTLISYSLIKDLGIVMTLLISFFGYVAQLLLALVFLKEVPAKKELLVGGAIMVCIFCGTLFG